MNPRLSFDDARNRLRWCNSFERLPEVLAMRRLMSAPDWWRLLGAEWDGFDNVGAHRDRLRGYLAKANASNRRAMMRSQEARALAAMPEMLTVYRGCHDINADGLCWSLSREIAERFPTLNRYRRAGDTPLLITGKVPKSLAVLKLCRKEREIVSAHVSHLAREAIAVR